jgi:hypothetical protein
MHTIEHRPASLTAAGTPEERPRRFRHIRAAVAMLVLVAAVVAVTHHPAQASTTTPTTALELLAALPVRAESTARYDRALFPHWNDADRDCQNTRAEVLIVESTAPVTFTTASRCTVATGRWYSWYDGRTWTRASDIDIDHVVALNEAWQSGAATWTTARRAAYANDLGFAGSLDGVTDSVNQAKSDKDPAQWMPPRTTVHCRYAIRWMLVKYRWQLSIDANEQTALAGVLNGSCGGVRVTVPARP